MKIIDVLLRRLGARDRKCPGEVDVLAYSENKLPTPMRVRVERHFATCDDCRQLLAFLGQESLQSAPAVSQAEASEQVSRVLGYIRNDELGQSRSSQKARPTVSGFHLSYPRLATVGLVVLAIVIASVSFLTLRQAAADAGMDALRIARKDKRRTEARISGGLEYSRYGAIRGEDANDDNLHYDRALGKLSSAEQDNSSVKDRVVLARIYLARGTRSDIDHALKILTQLSADGVETAEVLNDTGVAHMQRVEYEKAIEFFTRALSKSPDYDEALFNRALAEQRLHRSDDAKRDWEQFIDRSSDAKWKAEAAEHLKELGRAR